MTGRDSCATARDHSLHIGVAEAGKLRALAGDHVDALRHYREALRLARAKRAPEVFFRHYTQCVLESLEQTGSYGEVMEFCEKALRHHDTIEKPLALHLRDRAATLERLALNLIKADRLHEARAPLEEAAAMAAPDDIPVARTVLAWLQRGMAVQAQRICDLQNKHGYFTVTVNSVEPSRAIPLPKGVSERPGASP